MSKPSTMYSLYIWLTTVTSFAVGQHYEFHCPEGQYFSDHEDCSKFYQCERGHPVPKYCAPGTVFNPKMSICDWPYNVNCPGHEPASCAPDGSYFPDSENPQEFYHCDRGMPVPLHCPPGTVFNPMIETCDHPRNVYCGAPTMYLMDDNCCC